MVIRALDMFGTTVFAATGALAAGRKRMDVLGIMVVALATAVGGGTLRDVLLGWRPVFWVSDPTYVLFAALGAVLAIACFRFADSRGRLLLLNDAIGLAVFTIVGCQRAMDAGTTSIVAVLMGVTTGVAGGVFRDVLCGDVPVVLRSEIYATASLLGGTVFLIGRSNLPQPIAIALGMATTLLVRLVALRWHLSLPVVSGRPEPANPQENEGV